MKIEEYLQAKNAEYKELQGALQGDTVSKNTVLQDNKAFTRQMLLDLPTIGECEEDDLRRLFTAGISKKGELLDWRSLKNIYKTQYLLSIGYEAGKPVVEEIYSVWFNIDTKELSVKKPYDAFTAEDKCIFIDDYRILDSISWQDLVE